MQAGTEVAGRPSLTRHLLLWSLGALVLVWASFVLLGYQTGVHEADELTDGHLASVAALLTHLKPEDSMKAAAPAGAAASRPPPASWLRAHDYQQSLSVVQWNREGRLLSHSGVAPVPAFDEDTGFANLSVGPERRAWRSFSLWDDAHLRKIMVMVELRERDELAKDIAEQMVEPGLWLLPVVALALGFALHRGLRPLYALSEEVAALDDTSAQRLAPGNAWREFESVVASINTLLDRQQAALARERRLAHEVAHELRTPLSSMALQARALEAEADPQRRAQAVAQIGRDALRAGHVLNQLLSLARTSRTEQHEALVKVDLAALARTVAADYAQQAWQKQDDLAVEGLEALPVQGHPVLLEMALRNLVENALKHTPTGTQIATQLGLDAEGAWLAVSDDGRREAAAAGMASPPDSLHLGHAIVARVAEAHRGRFAEVLAVPPYTTCYRMGLPLGAGAQAG